MGGSGLGELKKQFKKFDLKIENTEGIVTRNSNNVTEIINKVTSQGKRLEGCESELFSGRDRMNKINDSVDNINQAIHIFESRHSETMERIKEVTILTTNIQSQVKAQELKMVEQSVGELNLIKEQIKSIETQTVISQQNIENLLVKVIQLEDSHMNQLQKVALVERLGERVSLMDEQRQH